MHRNESTLELARRHVATGERLVADQARIVNGLKAGKHSTRDAKRLLDTLKRTLALMHAHLAHEEDQWQDSSGTVEPSDAASRECPHCASSRLEITSVEYAHPPALAVQCTDCGALGPPSHDVDARQAILAWNQGRGRSSV